MDKNFLKKFDTNFKICLLVIALFTIIAFIGQNYYIATFELCVFVALIIYYFINKNINSKKLISHIERISYNLEEITGRSRSEFPVPMVVISLNGHIIWYNRHFKKIANTDISDASIQDLFENFHLLKILENKNNISFEMNHNNCSYLVRGNIIDYKDKNSESEYSIALYFIDKTSEALIKHQYNDEKLISCELMIDNLDELFKNTPEDEKAALSIGIEKKIKEWINQVNGVSRKYEKDKYHIVFENKYLDTLIDSKFSILHEIRNISNDKKIPVTLSIGIGAGANISESDSFAKAAIDMALGRGGDQVVIKNEKGLKFFGGNTDSTETTTKIKPRVVAYALREIINNSSNVFITGHKFMDADCLGSAIGISAIVKQLGKKAYIIYDNSNELVLEIMSSMLEDDENSDLFINEEQALQMYDTKSLIVITDTNSPDFVEAKRLYDEIENRVLIDHHRKSENTIKNAVISYHEPFASSASEMVTEIIQYINLPTEISSKVAHALYTGIILDTKNFTSKTGVRTFDAASYLRKAGVDTAAVKKMFQADIDTYTKKSKIVSTAEIYKEGIALSYFDESDENANLLCGISADELLNISGIEASFVLCRNDDCIYISGRSLGGINVQRILEQLEGGGHLSMAGAQLRNVSMTVALERLKEAIENII